MSNFLLYVAMYQVILNFINKVFANVLKNHATFITSYDVMLFEKKKYNPISNEF